jgi:transcriptional regulator with XRE-family HTH domain
LQTYRASTGTTQRDLAEALGYDTTYISAIENGRRRITNVNDLRRIAEHLGLAPHVLGVTDASDADFAAMLQFGESTLRLAAVARGAGKPADAVNELWPLIVRLEARAAEGHAERHVMSLLARARAQLGVFLGDVLPKERLATSARWTGRALRIASRLDNPDLHVYALRVHGNELRKAGNDRGAVARLRHAAEADPTPERSLALIQLARAVGEVGDAELFDNIISEVRHLADRQHGDPLFNPYVVYEVWLRGLMRTGRVRTAMKLLDQDHGEEADAAPQWRVIGQVTIGEVLLSAGETEGAAQALTAAITAADAQRLPQQIQRAKRAAGARLQDVAHRAEISLRRLTNNRRQSESRHRRGR